MERKIKNKNLIAFPLFLSFFCFHKALAQFVEEVPESGELQGNAVQRASFFDTAFEIIIVFLVILLIASLIGFVRAGIKLLIAGGGEESLEQGRTLAIRSLVGLVSVFVGYILLSIFRYFLT